MTAEAGIDRFLYKYTAYPHQKAFHESKSRYRLLGGAAGPGKTLALILDHMLTCNMFKADVAPEVHTLILRRTHPKLLNTVITRFREKIPKELYRDFNSTTGVVTWLNGSTTQFSSMQHEHDVWGFQGQFLKIAYDELTEFTFPQWQNISAWNRCPVSPNATKDGATNPIGIGARWVEDLFVKNTPCAEMDKNQRAQYQPQDYAYFAATYLDNPIYAQDEQYIANLDSYQGPVAQALKHGIWGVAGGYFDGAWDEAINVYPADSVEIQSWWKKWGGGDWGFEHNSALYKLAQDELGVVRVYHETVCNHHTPEELAERFAASCQGEELKGFWFAHDAFAQKQDVNTIALRMGAVFRKYGLPTPVSSTKDKVGREQIIYDMLKQRVQIGVDEEKRPIFAPRLQISDACPNLIRTIGIAPRDEKKVEEIAEFLGDDAIPGLGYPLYGMFGKPQQKPAQLVLNEQAKKIEDGVARHFWMLEQQKRLKERTDSFQPQTRPIWQIDLDE